MRKRPLYKVTKCRSCKFVFAQIKEQNRYLCATCRTPEKMAAAGYGWNDITVEANVSEQRARDVVFRRHLEKAS